MQTAPMTRLDSVDVLFHANPNQWVSEDELRKAGGSAWRTRVSDLRRTRQRIIQNRLVNDKGERVTEYRLLVLNHRTESVPLADLVGEQVRLSLNQARVQDYTEKMRAGVPFPPIDVFRDEDGTLRLADGFHRRAAAVACGHESIPAILHPGTADDALWHAIGANGKHGLNLNDGDKKHAITLALERWPDKSTTLIAEQVGCTHQHVQAIKAKVASACNLPVRVTGKDGKSYPAKQDKSRKAVAERVTKISELAASGASTPQIAAAVGIGEERVRQVCKAKGITVPADAVMRNTRRIDSNKIIEKTVEAAVMLTEETRFIDWKEVDYTRVAEWVTSLRQAKTAITRFIHRLEEARQ